MVNHFSKIMSIKKHLQICIEPTLINLFIQQLFKNYDQVKFHFLNITTFS